MTVSKEVWEELLKEKICFIEDVDNQGRMVKFISPQYIDYYSNLPQEEQENLKYKEEELGGLGKHCYKIQNGEIKKYTRTQECLVCSDPYLGTWNRLSLYNIYLEDWGQPR